MTESSDTIHFLQTIRTMKNILFRLHNVEIRVHDVMNQFLSRLNFCRLSVYWLETTLLSAFCILKVDLKASPACKWNFFRRPLLCFPHFSSMATMRTFISTFLHFDKSSNRNLCRTIIDFAGTGHCVWRIESHTEISFCITNSHVPVLINLSVAI